MDTKFVRQNPDLIRDVLKKRRYDFDLDRFLELDRKRRSLISEIDTLRAEQNKANQEIQRLLKQGEDVAPVVKEMKTISDKVDNLQTELKSLKEEFEHALLRIPNIPHASVPEGSASQNTVVKTWGTPPELGFKPLTHIELSEHLDIIDFKRASKLCGSNFVMFKGDGARLERALINFMLDLHSKKHGYKEVSPPSLVNRESMTTTGQLPNLEEDMYRLKDDDYFLIPTAEVPVTNIHRDEVLDEDDLPLRYVAYTACFRREAGSYGKDTKGLIRVHQFDKVELVKFATPRDSYDELEHLLNDACEVLELLSIPYRVILLASEEISFAASKCYDIEIFALGLNKWLEVSSCSNFEDFQARRGNIRYKDKETKKIRFVHTLNGSGVALARLVICILENYQTKEGTVIIPEVLREYMDGKTRITK